MRNGLKLSVIALALLPLTACTLRGTTQQITDTTQNTTVSTSGRTWFSEDGLVRQGEEVNAFAALNFDNLQQDMATGGGEYLTALGHLLGVPAEEQPLFFELAQTQFQTTSRPDLTPSDLLAGLNRAVASHAVRHGS